MKFCPQCRADLESRSIDGRDRLVCTDDCGFVHWNNPTPVVAAIIEYDGKVLLARNAAWPSGWFALVTGFLEYGETPEQGVAREVAEEIGLEAAEVNFFGNYAFFEQNQLLIVFHVVARGEIELGEEIAEVQLLEHAAVKPWDMGTGPALKDWLAVRA